MKEIITKVSILRIAARTGVPMSTPVWTDNTGMITGKGRSHFTWQSNFHSMHIVSRGTGYFRTGTHTFKLTPGSMFCLWPGIACEYCKAPSNPWTVHWINLRGANVRDYAETCGFHPACQIIAPYNPGMALRIFRVIFEQFQIMTERHPCRLIAWLFKLADACRGPEPEPPTTPPPGAIHADIVHRAMALLQSPHDLALSVSPMARHLHVSRSTLFKAFVRVRGQRPVEAIMARRMEQARHLLQNTDLKIAVVAAMSGMPSEKYFYHWFKKHAGMAPGAWRREVSARRGA